MLLGGDGGGGRGERQHTKFYFLADMRIYVWPRPLAFVHIGQSMMILKSWLQKKGENLKAIRETMSLPFFDWAALTNKIDSR